MKGKGIFRALTAVAVFVLVGSLVAGPIMESYRQPIDTYFGETSYRMEGSGQAEWIYQSEFKNQTEGISWIVISVVDTVFSPSSSSLVSSVR